MNPNINWNAKSSVFTVQFLFETVSYNKSHEVLKADYSSIMGFHTNQALLSSKCNSYVFFNLKKKNLQVILSYLIWLIK